MRSQKPSTQQRTEPTNRDWLFVHQSVLWTHAEELEAVQRFELTKQMTTTESVNGEFWSETFDTDLYKVLPDVRQVLEVLDGTPIYTVGHKTNGRLNHPTCWNSDGGLVSYFGFRNQPQEFVPGYCYYGRAEVVECTFAEVIRDAWVHSIRGLIKGPFGYQVLFDSQRIYWAFSDIMYDVRGWNQPNRNAQDVWKAKQAARRWVIGACKRFTWWSQELNADRIRRD